MKQFIYSVLMLSLAYLEVSCSSHHNDRDPRERSFWDAFWDNSYNDAFEDHTKRESVMSEFEPVMTIYATNWDQTMRDTYIKEMVGQYRLNPTAEEKLTKEQLAENEAYYVFVLTAATREPEWNDFERKTSIWRITLENENGSIQLDPERIETVSQKDEKAKYFYTKMSPFTKTYRVRFEKKALYGAHPLKLHVSGAHGHVTFTW